jgi:N-acetyl sugar amidotransferase
MQTDSFEFRRCTDGVWDTSVPGIAFDDEGKSNYSEMFRLYSAQYPKGPQGIKDWNSFIDKMKSDGAGKSYDCIIGVSGGTDSSYLLHLAKKVYGLRPLAVTFDNGWSSDISVRNIRVMTDALSIDLETYVVDYEEMKDILVCYMKAGLPWIDFPTDHAIKSVLYKIAKKEKIPSILIGHDFRSEGTQPNEWTYGDSRQLKWLHRRFGTVALKSYPSISFFAHAWMSYVNKIKMIYPFFFIDYDKKSAQDFLKAEYGWEYYGGHHHENAFTKFAIADWMPNKFGIDKRLITYSAQVLSGQMDRNVAIEQLSHPPSDPVEAERDRVFIMRKLGLTPEQFETIWNAPNHSFEDYPSNHALLVKIAGLMKPFVKLFLAQMPSYFVQLEVRARSKATGGRS